MSRFDSSVNRHIKIKNNQSEDNIMDLRIMITENRIELLKSRDPVVNARIIRKLERKLKRLKGENEHM